MGIDSGNCAIARVNQNLKSKAPEDLRTPRRSREFHRAASMRQLLECGSPLPLLPGITDAGYNVAPREVL
jgi:hypothetical protein